MDDLAVDPPGQVGGLLVGRPLITAEQLGPLPEPHRGGGIRVLFAQGSGPRTLCEQGWTWLRGRPEGRPLDTITSGRSDAHP